jgi:hypothetical protein
VNAKEALEAVRAAEAAAPRGPCDWCRREEDTDAHRLVCREHLAWVLHPDKEIHRDYWILVGDFHKLHITQVLGFMHPVGDPQNPGLVHVFVATRPRRNGWGDHQGDATYQSLGPVNAADGYVFNTLAGARARGLRIVAHYDETSRIARANVEGPPTVRKYAKTVAAKRLAPDSGGSDG